jgi:hypothetical protein
MNYRTVIGLIAVALLSQAIGASYTDLVPKYNRTTARIMARSIAVPTKANLDFAAYASNPIRIDPEKLTPKKPAKPVTIAAMTFGGALKKAVATLAETPLTKEELDQPLAWAPLTNYLDNELKIPALKAVGTKIIGEKWGDPEIFKPYQDIAALYLHTNGKVMELWIKVEFMPWVSFLQGIGDADKDGFKEIYGELNTDSIPAAQLTKSLTWITSDYMVKKLTKEEITDWANVLASYWYPTLNTDIFDMSAATQWPTSETEPDVKSTIKGLVIKSPTAVIRGNPYGKVLYNIFVVEGLNKKDSVATPAAATPGSGAPAALDTATSSNFKENNARFALEVQPFGNYNAWNLKAKPIHDGLRKVLAALPADQMGIQGSDGWLFFRKSIDYIVCSDLSQQPEKVNPLPPIIEFKKFLDKNNINLLFVAVPCKEELYCEKLGVHPSDATGGAIISPFGRKILADLQKNGIEVIDLLPRFLAAKAVDAKQDEPVYQHQDTHWTNRGLEIAAGLIADRIKQYAWYGATTAQRKSYAIFDTTFLRPGDIIERIPEAERTKYKAPTLKAQQVITPEKKKYVPDPAGPVMLIGDSFTGVFELVDCKSAGVGSHIAVKTGLPVDIMTSWGGGPMIMNKMLRARQKTLSSKRLVIYMMTARDLNNYSQGWEKLNVQ